MLKNEKILNFWFPVIVYSGIIFLVSGIPNVNAPVAEQNLDKLIHFIEYIPFGFLVCRALRGSFYGLSGNNVIGVVFFVTLLYAASDEFHQSFVPGRNCDWHDLVADALGGLVGSSIYVVQHLRNRKDTVNLKES